MLESREDVQAIQAATELLVQGLSKSDISSITDLATDTTVLLPAGRRTFKGRTAVEFWRNFAIANEDVRMSSTGRDALGEGLVRDVGTLTMKPRQGGQASQFRYMVLWQKVGEAWTIATMTWNRGSQPEGRRRPGNAQAQAGGGM